MREKVAVRLSPPDSTRTTSSGAKSARDPRPRSGSASRRPGSRCAGRRRSPPPDPLRLQYAGRPQQPRILVGVDVVGDHAELSSSASSRQTVAINGSFPVPTGPATPSRKERVPWSCMEQPHSLGGVVLGEHVDQRRPVRRHLVDLGRRDIGDEALDVVMQPGRPARRVGRICRQWQARPPPPSARRRTRPTGRPAPPTACHAPDDAYHEPRDLSLSRLRYRSTSGQTRCQPQVRPPLPPRHTPQHLTGRPNAQALSTSPPPRPQLSRHSVVDFRRLRARSQQKSTTRRRSSESDMAGEYGGGFDSGDGAGGLGRRRRRRRVVCRRRLARRGRPLEPADWVCPPVGNRPSASISATTSGEAHQNIA